MTAQGQLVNHETPEGWARTPLGPLLREPLRNGHSAKASGNGKGVRTLTLTAVTYSDFNETNTKLTTADPRKVADLWLQPGDILVERANTPELVGTSCLYKGSSGWAIFPDLLIRVRVANEKILPEYLEAFLRSQEARHYFMNAAQGTAGSMPKIDQSSIERLDIPLPPFAEQRRIVAKVQVLLARVSAARERLEKVPILLKRFR